MKQSINHIWKKGFADEKLVAPRINQLYSQKSINVVELLIGRFKKEIISLIPLAIAVIAINIILDNDYAILWGFIGAMPLLLFFYLGKRQIKSLINIDYKSNCYEYLISVRDRINSIAKFNKRLSISSVPILLFPMLVYTYYNQKGRSIGDLFGVEGIDLPIGWIFMILPIMMLVAFIVAEFVFNISMKRNTATLTAIIEEIEVLRK
ncbi:MAG: hypothetical protein ABJG47_10080 [Ekhidna sp.]